MLTTNVFGDTRILRTLAAVGTVVLLSGCVSQQQYYEEQQRTARAEAGEVVLTEAVLLQEAELEMLRREQEEIAAELEVLVIAGSIKMELMKSGLHITMEDDVLFESGSSIIKSDGKKVLKQLSGELSDVPYQIVVLGNADSSPIVSSRYPSNWNLAGDRAANVVNLMIAEGIPGIQLAAVSLGDTQPIASNETAAGRKANRRIEIRLRPVVKGADSR
jgi:chemotaxis protein MotB